MNNLAIKVEGVKKRYHRGTSREQTNSLFTNLQRGLSGPFRRLRKLATGQATGASELDEAFWAIDDVSFSVEPGEVVGIIGSNGAGKSTILKILARITGITAGKIEITGRTAALLEVGTGFHPEMTGRENAYLNGAILGMSRKEVHKKFDEIVAFSGVEKFIDTPVKHYSSGMRVRLGFAVAAHLDSDILIIDEVLAVGDAEFQRRCLGKMDDVAKSGRTVIFVSHNMVSVQELCPRTILLADGKILFDGPTDSTIETYLVRNSNFNSDIDLRSLKRGAEPINDDVRFVRCEVLDEQDQPSTTIHFGQPLHFRLGIESKVNMDDINVILRLDSIRGVQLLSFRSQDFSKTYHVESGKLLTVDIKIPNVVLQPGSYIITLGLRNRDKQPLDVLTQVIRFEVLRIHAATSKIPFAPAGLVAPEVIWN